ncbi:MAG: AI-2E family transporter [Planctomycetota bacterium]
MDRIVPQRFLKPVTFGIFAIGTIALMIWLRSIFAPLLAGFFIAYILDPLADALEKKGMKRTPSVILIFILASVLILTSLLAGSVAVARGGASLVTKLRGDHLLETMAVTPSPPADAILDSATGQYFIDRDGDGVYDPGWVRDAQQILEKDFPGVAVGFNRWKDRISARFGDDTEEDEDEILARRVEAGLDATLGRVIEAYLGPAEGQNVPATEDRLTGKELVVALEKIQGPTETEGKGPGALDRLLALGNWILLLPIYVFFFLIEIDPMIVRIRNWIPSSNRARSEKIASEIHAILSSFFRGRLLVCIIKGVMTGIGLMFTGVPHGFLIGFVAGFLSLIPYLGVWLVAIPAVAMCWFENHDVVLLVATGGIFAAMEALEGFVLIPRFLGEEVGLHPVTVIVTFLIFAQWFGVIGMLLSVPLAAITKILAREFLLPIWKEGTQQEPEPSGT